ncbi:phenylhydantoinase [Arthrobacter sp. Hiyo8]|nr:phenylhydantoinase [Arthrobacter sp. Hiyo8]
MTIPDLVIAHGTVVNSFGRQAAHVVVDGGRIIQLIDAAEPVPRPRVSSTLRASWSSRRCGRPLPRGPSDRPLPHPG